jgi:hypothetical protein
MGLSKPDVSKMLQGAAVSPLSLERLMRCLMALGHDVTIDVGPAKQKPRIKMTVR